MGALRFLSADGRAPIASGTVLVCFAPFSAVYSSILN